MPKKKPNAKEKAPTNLDFDVTEGVDEKTDNREVEQEIEEMASKEPMLPSSLTGELNAQQARRHAGSSAVLSSVVLSSVVGLIAGLVASIYIAPHLAGKLPWAGTGGKNDGFLEQTLVVNEDSAITQVVEEVSPAVVSIIVTKDLPKVEQYYYNPFGDDFFPPFSLDIPSPETEPTRVGAGSGFIVTDDGMIVTNRHVVEDEQAEYTVVTSDGTSYPAKVLARDTLNDLAIVKIDAKDLPTVALGDSDSVKPGQRVVAIGNALGELYNSVTSGVVSGLGRTISAGNGLGEVERLDEVIQTDAAINPGNSGGPLLNLAGQVIGINTAIDRSGQLVGFAIPSNEARKVVSDVREHGRILRPYIGIRYVIIGPAYAEANKLPVDYGALLVSDQATGEEAVVKGSPAEAAGLQAGDIILEISGERIDLENTLLQRMKKYEPGDQVILKARRDNQTIELLLELGERT